MSYPLVPLFGASQSFSSYNAAFSLVFSVILFAIGSIILVVTVKDIESDKKQNRLHISAVRHRRNLQVAFLVIGCFVLLSVLGVYLLALLAVLFGAWVLWIFGNSFFKGVFLLFGVKPDSSIIKWYNRIG